MKGVSITICTYNGRDRLAPTLSSVLAQKVENFIPWEILVVDNNSNDGTLRYCEDFLEKSNHGVSWKVISEKEPGLSHARKAGVLNSRYDYVIFCDDDNWLSEDYVRLAFTQIDSKPEVGIVGGLGIPEFESAPPDWFSLYSSSYAIGPAARLGYLKGKEMVYGAGMVLRKQLILDLYLHGFESLLSDRKGSDLVSGGDNEICMWYLQAGYRIYYEETLTFTHFIPKERLTFDYLVKRAAGKGKTEALFLIYKSAIANGQKLSWLHNLVWYYWEISKRVILLFKANMKPTKENLLSSSLLKSAVKFRFRNYSLLVESEKKCFLLLSYLRS